MSKSKIFISHSSKDKQIVTDLATLLTKDSVWFDMWDMDAGDELSDKIEKGIDEAKVFLIILSNNSIKSSWAQFELNMALIKYLEEEDYRIIVARIDDVKVPLKLKPFLRIDCNSQKDIPSCIYRELQKSNTQSKKSTKRQFINRHDEISTLQDVLFEAQVKFINIVGFYGIGKTSLTHETLKRVYSDSNIIEVVLSPAHFGARLTIDLCSLAKIELPIDGASDEDLMNHNILAIETILSRGCFVIFNRFESILNDDGIPNTDISLIFQYFEKNNTLNELPFIILSTRWPNFENIDKKSVYVLKVDGLNNKHLGFILKNEVERIIPGIDPTYGSLDNLASLLHGYPLAARLAAPIIAKYKSAEYLINNLHLVNQIKSDIAEDIISRFSLNELEINTLEVLALFEHPLSPIYISQVLSLSAEQLNIVIGNLVAFNVIETDGKGIMLHPLVNSYYFKQARSNSNFQIYSEKLAEIAKERLKSLKNTDNNYVYWLTSACRLLFYCGKLEEGQQLRSDLIGEVKDAAIKLYQSRDFTTSLKFCNNYLESRPNDKDILFTKARNLSRLGDYTEAISIIEDLIKYEKGRYLLAKYYYGLGRVYLENNQENSEFTKLAEEAFVESIRKNEHTSALQSMGELLYKQGKYNEALSFIERKLNHSPADPFALNIYADTLWALDRKPEAIDKIIDAIKYQPKNPNFLFRAGRFMQESNKEGAYGFFRDAIMYDKEYIDARLSLADICIDLNRLDEAKDNLEYIAKKVVGDKKNIYDSIRANLDIKEGKLESAESIILNLIKRHRNVVNIGLLAKLHIAKAKAATDKGFVRLADSDKTKALDLLKEGLLIDPDNIPLKGMLESIS